MSAVNSGLVARRVGAAVDDEVVIVTPSGCSLKGQHREVISVAITVQAECKRPLYALTSWLPRSEGSLPCPTFWQTCRRSLPRPAAPVTREIASFKSQARHPR